MRASAKSAPPSKTGGRRAFATHLALQVGPPFIALAVAGVWLFHLSTQAALVAAILAIGICATYAAGLRTLLARDREAEAIETEARLQAEIDFHKKQIDQANHRLAARVRELSLLFDITRSINGTLELGELIEILPKMIGGGLSVQEFAMLLRDEKTGELKAAATHGVPGTDGVRTLRLDLRRGAAERAVERAEVVLIDDVQDEPSAAPDAQRPVVGSFLAVPLKVKGRTIGALTFSRPNPNAFPGDDIKLLAAIANQAAMAIMNAQLHRETVELSLTDPLTGTANRRHLFQQLDMEVSRAQRFGNELTVLMIDIDHFKLYNDQHGHLAGDEVLKSIGRALLRTVRKIDTVARYGGEEFVVLLPQIRRQEAMFVGDKLRRAISHLVFPAAGAPGATCITVSVGLAHFPIDAQGSRELIARADEALYAAKNGGRNRLVAYANAARAKAAPAMPAVDRA